MLPQTVVFPEEIVEYIEAITPSEALFQKKSRNYMLQITHIPAYLLYDGFGMELTAEVVYKCVLPMTGDETEMLRHSNMFSKVCMVTLLNPAIHIIVRICL